MIAVEPKSGMVRIVGYDGEVWMLTRVEAAELAADIISACAMSGDISDSPSDLQDELEAYRIKLKKEYSAE